MSKLLPYPGRYESFSSWDYRCKEWEKERERHSRFLNSMSSNWGGYNYIPVQNGGTYNLSGRKINVIKVFPSKSKLKRATNFTSFTPKSIIIEVQLGNPKSITSRKDYLVVSIDEEIPALPSNARIYKDQPWDWSDFKRKDREMVYNNDDH